VPDVDQPGEARPASLLPTVALSAMVPVTIVDVQILPKLRKLRKLPEVPKCLNLLGSRTVRELADFRIHVGAISAAGGEKAGWRMCGADGLTMTLPVR
jgi:hypothetical protein